MENQNETEFKTNADSVGLDPLVRWRLELFAKDFLKWLQDDFMKIFGEDGSEEICEMLKKRGFMEYVPRDAEKHEHIEGEEGDMIWIMTDDAMQAIKTPST